MNFEILDWPDHDMMDWMHTPSLWVWIGVSIFLFIFLGLIVYLMAQESKPTSDNIENTTPPPSTDTTETFSPRTPSFPEIPPDQIIYCSQCGMRLPHGSLFCPNCGASLE
ncbi:MAG: zinc-ribbon domain-containing protein [Candidatus Helarchaeota archaeon]